ncbi:uncharacterized protein LOC132921133 [Rhopalosiphum padi]|uniref:uncharacterized protein LOC132921133 n=1 Tax=Rhopalosiphum padi TaxID=40932 RepID=UPI00298E6CF4|nr:uncharacterized protein LOC132921133 [Rhopalosiphum padi]
MLTCTASLSTTVVCCTLLIVTVTARHGQSVARLTTSADWRGDIVHTTDIEREDVVHTTDIGREDIVHTTDIGREDVVHTTEIGRDTITSGGSSSCCDGQYTAATSSPSHNTVASPRKIPLDVIIELNQVTNVSELFSKFIPDTNLDEAQTLFFTTGFQSRTTLNIERKSTLVPKPAGCSPVLKTVSLKDTDDQSLYYHPATCIQVYRCGGCCLHDLLECQPTKVDTIDYEVMVSQYKGAGKFDFLGRKIVSIEQHLKCKCGCVVKQENCTSLQTYNPKQCICTCSNQEDLDKCIEENGLKLWNSATCRCQCREVKECTSGFGFNYNTCRCEALRQRIKNTAYEFNKNTYSLGET